MNSLEIAKIAGVSRSTVSRVVNNYGNVPKETRDKVLEVVKKYNYVPHASARMLAGMKSRIIGLFIIDMKEESSYHKMTTSSYFSPFTNAVIDTANKQQYNILISLINKPRDFKNAKEMFYNKTISGGIFIGGNNNEPDIREIIEEGYKVAVIEQDINDEQDTFNKCILINSDSFGGAFDATNYLIKLGHKKISHIVGDMGHRTGFLRLEGYKKALSDAGIIIKNNLIIKGNYTEESGYKAGLKLLSREIPTAIFAGNDSMSIGVIRAIQEANLKIPDDISIVGFDDIEVARYLQPALTTVKIPLFEMASIAVNNLIKASEEDNSFYANYKIPLELVIRNSCRSI
ncbi:MAG: transcriptional regulator [Clostridiales bacterium]|jgi:LacI family transcriptional regulator|nr:transcriptional regulator [Clostridiales bacterium]